MANSAVPPERALLPPLGSLPKRKKSPAEVLALYLLPKLDKSEQDAPKMLSIDKSGAVLIWTAGPDQPRQLMQLNAQPRAVALSGHNLWLAVSFDREIKIFSLAGKEPVRSLPPIGTRISSLDFEPSGKSLLLGGADGRIYRWKLHSDDGASQKSELLNVERYIGPASSLTSVIFHPSGRVFFDGQVQGGISAWLTHESDLFGGRYDENLFGSRFFSEKSARVVVRNTADSGVSKLALNAGGNLLCSASEDGSLEFWDVRGLRKMLDLDAHKGLIYDFTLSADGTRIASIGRDGKLKVYKLEMTLGDQIQSNLSAKSIFEAVLPLARKLLMLSNEQIAAAGADGKVAILDIAAQADQKPPENGNTSEA